VGMAAQLTLMNGPSAATALGGERLERPALFQYPVSPKNQETEASVGATVITLIEHLLEGGTVTDNFRENRPRSEPSPSRYLRSSERRSFQDFDLDRSAVIFQGRRRSLDRDLIQQNSRSVGMEGIPARAAQNQKPLAGPFGPE